jgi:hypothetical protein
MNPDALPDQQPPTLDHDHTDLERVGEHGSKPFGVIYLSDLVAALTLPGPNFPVIVDQLSSTRVLLS